MMKTIEGLPAGVIGVDGEGEVTAADYERVLMPAIARALEGRPKIRLLYHLGREFTGFTAGALIDDAKVGLHDWKAFEKCAVVTDVKWVRDSITLFRVLLPCPTKVFSNAELAQAKAWITP